MSGCIVPEPITLFLDFDGVLHQAGSVAGRSMIVQRGPDGRELYLFHRAEAVAAALNGIGVDVVLSSSWVQTYGYQQCVDFLPPSLAARVVGATAELALESACWSHFTRYQQINTYVDKSGTARWLALDDDDRGWPEEQRHRLICTSPERGVTDLELAELARRLRAMK